MDKTACNIMSKLVTNASNIMKITVNNSANLSDIMLIEIGNEYNT